MGEFLDINCETEEVKSLHSEIKNKVASLQKIDISKVDDDLLKFTLLLFENRNSKEDIIDELKMFFSKEACSVFVNWLWDLLTPISHQQKRKKFEVPAKKFKINDGKPAYREEVEVPSQIKNLKTEEVIKNNLFKQEEKICEKQPQRVDERTREIKTDVQHSPVVGKVIKTSVVNKKGKELGDGSKDIQTTLKENQNQNKVEKIVEKEVNFVSGKTSEDVAKKETEVRKENPRPNDNRKIGEMKESGTINNKLGKSTNDQNLNLEIEAEQKMAIVESKRKAETDDLPFHQIKRSFPPPNNTFDPRAAIKCHYWPNCTKGESCPFAHPESICVYFPNCARGSACKFLHVQNSDAGFAAEKSFKPCFYGEACKNRNCKFSHGANESRFVGWNKIIKDAPSAQAIPCRYGSNCHLQNCHFAHSFDLGTKDQEPIGESKEGSNFNSIFKENGKQEEKKEKKMCNFDKKCQKINCPLWHPLRERELRVLIERSK